MSKSKSNTANEGSVVEIWREKANYLERELAIAADPVQKFELRTRIAEARREIQKRESGKPRSSSPLKLVLSLGIPVILVCLILLLNANIEELFKVKEEQAAAGDIPPRQFEPAQDPADPDDNRSDDARETLASEAKEPSEQLVSVRTETARLAIPNNSAITSAEAIEEERGAPLPAGSTVSIHVNKIDNQEFIFTSTPWPFPTDASGEDIKGPYTSLFERGQIVPKHRFTTNYPTIANRYLKLKFHLLNSSLEPVYLESFFLEVVGAHKTTMDMFWNVWMPIPMEHDYKVTIDDSRKRFLVSDKLIQLDPAKPEHFLLKVEVDPVCSGKIYRFRLVYTVHDDLGTKTTVVGEKVYKLGLIESNPFKKGT